MHDAFNVILWTSADICVVMQSINQYSFNYGMTECRPWRSRVKEPIRGGVAHNCAVHVVTLRYTNTKYIQTTFFLGRGHNDTDLSQMRIYRHKSLNLLYKVRRLLSHGVARVIRITRTMCHVIIDITANFTNWISLENTKNHQSSLKAGPARPTSLKTVPARPKIRPGLEDVKRRLRWPRMQHEPNMPASTTTVNEVQNSFRLWRTDGRARYRCKDPLTTSRW